MNDHDHDADTLTDAVNHLHNLIRGSLIGTARIAEITGYSRNHVRQIQSVPSLSPDDVLTAINCLQPGEVTSPSEISIALGHGKRGGGAGRMLKAMDLPDETRNRIVLLNDRTGSGFRTADGTIVPMSAFVDAEHLTQRIAAAQ